MEHGYTALSDNLAIRSPSLRDKVAKGACLLLIACLTLACYFQESRVPEKLHQSGSGSLALQTAEEPEDTPVLAKAGVILFVAGLLLLKKEDFANLWLMNPDASDGEGGGDISPSPLAIAAWVVQLLVEILGSALFLLVAFGFDDKVPTPGGFHAATIGSCLILVSLLLTIIKCLLNVKHYFAERLKHFEMGVHYARDHKPEWRKANTLLMFQWVALQKTLSVAGALCLFTGYTDFKGDAHQGKVLLVGHFLFVAPFFFACLNIALSSIRNPGLGSDTYGTEIELGSDNIVTTIMNSLKKCMPKVGQNRDNDLECCGTYLYVQFSSALFLYAMLALYVGSVLVAFGGSSTGTTACEVGMKQYLIAAAIPNVHVWILYPRTYAYKMGKDVPCMAIVLIVLIETVILFLAFGGAMAGVGAMVGVKPCEIPVAKAGGILLLSVMVLEMLIFNNKCCSAGGPPYLPYNFGSVKFYQNIVLVGALLFIIASE